MTYTVANLELSAEAFQEIKFKLLKAGYQYAFMPGGGIDMTGIAVIAEKLSAQVKQEVTEQPIPKFLWGLPVVFTDSLPKDIEGIMITGPLPTLKEVEEAGSFSAAGEKMKSQYSVLKRSKDGEK